MTSWSDTKKKANFPEERAEPSPPFPYSGIDCFGRFYVKDGQTQQKKYGLLFTCMAARAVHLELLDDMSTDAFKWSTLLHHTASTSLTNQM